MHTVFLGSVWELRKIRTVLLVYVGMETAIIVSYSGAQEQ